MIDTVTDGTKTLDIYFHNLRNDTGTVTFKANWQPIGDTKALTSVITPENYGDEVVYSAGGVSDWKIFYDDEDYVYLITSNSIPHALVDTEEIGLMVDGTNYVQFETIPTSTQPYTNFIEPIYDIENKDFVNAKITSVFLNTDNWKQFVTNAKSGTNTISGGNMAAQGEPTAEMWVASWNAKNSEKFGLSSANTGASWRDHSNQPCDYYVFDPNELDPLFFGEDYRFRNLFCYTRRLCE